MSSNRNPHPELPFVDVPAALEEFKAGRMLIVVDDEDRENEGDLTLAAEFVTSRKAIQLSWPRVLCRQG